MTREEGITTAARMVLALEKHSTDRDTQVGCVITEEDCVRVLAVGANHHTDGVEPDVENTTRPEKYDWIEHAERNAIYYAARMGIPLANTAMHLPGFPCVECARAIAQSGVTTLYHGSTEGWDNTRYKFDKSRKILEAAGVSLIERDVHEAADSVS